MLHLLQNDSCLRHKLRNIGIRRRHKFLEVSFYFLEILSFLFVSSNMKSVVVSCTSGLIEGLFKKYVLNRKSLATYNGQLLHIIKGNVFKKCFESFGGLRASSKPSSIYSIAKYE